MVFQLFRNTVERGRKRSSQPQLVVLFDGPKLRFESLTREYAYTVLGGDDRPETAELVRRADSMDQDRLVRASAEQTDGATNALSHVGRATRFG